MLISQLLAKKGASVATVGPESPVNEVVKRLALHRVGALVVSSDGNTVAGIVSERDVVLALDRLGPAVLAEPVRAIMSATVRTCTPEDTVDSLASLMTEHRVRHVPVLEHGLLAGIVSIGDVVKTRMDELEKDRDALASYISAR